MFLSFLDHSNYLILNLLSDVFLDTFGFSGANTTLAALACNLPVVTCPGEFMRSCMSYGMLKMLGLSETIAQNEVEYIEIAVRLGLDAEWRHQIVKYIVKHKNCLFDDTVCVAALEQFYQQVVRERHLPQP